MEEKTEKESGWERYWGEESNQQYWMEPDDSVIELAAKLDKDRLKDVLDLGCGVGRHAIHLAVAGFNVTALDSSAEALKVLRRQAIEKKLRIEVIRGDYRNYRFADDSFDFILSYNVLYHGYRETFKEVVRQIHNWLRRDGQLLFTCPTREDGKYGSGEMVAPHTYRPANSIHPGDLHYFADENDISDFLAGFKDISMSINEHYWDNQGIRQFSSYWQISAVK